MARKPTPTSSASPESGGDKPERDRIIEAFMVLLADKPIEQIGFAEIAKASDVSLSELRGLYEPSFTPVVAPPAPEEAPAGGLVRRTPKAATEAAGPPPPPAPRTRNAAEVRGMLSGFRAGVERGRGSDLEAAPADSTTDSATS